MWGCRISIALGQPDAFDYFGSRSNRRRRWLILPLISLQLQLSKGVRHSLGFHLRPTPFFLGSLQKRQPCVSQCNSKTSCPQNPNEAHHSQGRAGSANPGRAWHLCLSMVWSRSNFPRYKSGGLSVDGCEIHFAPQNEPWLQPSFVGIYGESPFQAFLGDAGFCASTVGCLRWYFWGMGCLSVNTL